MGNGEGEEYDMPSQWFIIVAFLRMTLKPWRGRNRGTAKTKESTAKDAKSAKSAKEIRGDLTANHANERE